MVIFVADKRNIEIQCRIEVFDRSDETPHRPHRPHRHILGIYTLFLFQHPTVKKGIVFKTERN